ncbi:uncharacterized protein KGF55_001639 [Candida pseudojiufengensis]|uniref:uncharacterized protein n=1 Tax=Candida pseudojiufengensis TaxID=497109 RepID=UPI002224528B|nr:uncharacterized protein KGF55_001639 [Candida pseudojiufengensis]KAI5964570.1 hypothetical protein KGF55_001639 [Candida pseudojiufengensis]
MSSNLIQSIKELLEVGEQENLSPNLIHKKLQKLLEEAVQENSSRTANSSFNSVDEDPDNNHAELDKINDIGQSVSNSFLKDLNNTSKLIHTFDTMKEDIRKIYFNVNLPKDGDIEEWKEYVNTLLIHYNNLMNDGPIDYNYGIDITEINKIKNQIKNAFLQHLREQGDENNLYKIFSIKIGYDASLEEFIKYLDENPIFTIAENIELFFDSRIEFMKIPRTFNEVFDFWLKLIESDNPLYQFLSELGAIHFELYQSLEDDTVTKKEYLMLIAKLYKEKLEFNDSQESFSMPDLEFFANQISSDVRPTME